MKNNNNIPLWFSLGLLVLLCIPGVGTFFSVVLILFALVSDKN